MHIRWGRGMEYRLVRQEGWLVNHTRVHRFWREEGLQRPTPRRQKRAKPANGSVRRHQAENPHQVWAMDFHFDATADGRRLKFLNVMTSTTVYTWRFVSAGAARQRMLCRCWRSSRASTRHRRSSAATTVLSSLPML